MKEICQVCGIEKEHTGGEVRDNFCEECWPCFEAATAEFDPAESLPPNPNLWISTYRNAAYGWRMRAEKAEAELAKYVLCDYCRQNGKVHVAVSGDQMTDADHVWALVNGAEVYHKESE